MPASVRRTPFDAAASHAISWGALAVAAGLIGSCLWSYWPTLVALWEQWQRDADQSVGMLVAPACLYLIHRQRHRLKDVPWRSALLSGMVILLIAQSLRFFGVFAMTPLFQRISLVVSVWAAVIAICGWSICRRIVYPLLLLLLLVPLPKPLQGALAHPLQSVATSTSTFSLVVIGVPATRRGNVIDLGNGQQIAVAEACSGLRMIMGFVLVAAVFAYIATPQTLSRVILLVSSIPLAIVCNTLRIVATAILYRITDASFAEQFFHDFAGLAMMPLAVGLMLIECRLLTAIIPEFRTRRARPLRSTKRKDQGTALRGGAVRSGRPALPAVGVLAVVLTLAGLGHRSALAWQDDLGQRYLPPSVRLAEFPDAIGGRLGKDEPFSSDAQRIAGVDDFVNRRYVSTGTEPVLHVYVGYWGRPQSGLGHGPEICLPSHGWEERSKPAREVLKLGADVDSRLRTIPYLLGEYVRRDAYDSNRLLVASFYLVEGKPVANMGYLARIGPPFAPVRRYLFNVQVTAPLLNGRADETARQIRGFMRLLVPHLAKHLPALDARGPD